MRKNPPIRIRKRDREEIARLNKSISNKKSRLRRQDGVEAVFETRGITTFRTRREYNEYKKAALDFKAGNFNVANQHGVEMSYQEFRIMENRRRELNREKLTRLEEIKNLQMTDRGRQVPKLTIEQMREFVGDPRFDNLRLKKPVFQKARTERELEAAKVSLFDARTISETDELLRENLINAIQEVFDDTPLESDARVLIDYIKEMTIRQFMEKWYTESYANIRHVYSLEEAELKLEELKKAWM